MLTQLPGFRDPVHDAQRTFRVLLDGLAHPGTLGTLEVEIEPPADLAPACAAACLTLMDLETQVWLQPGLAAVVRGWLQFHTGCRFTDDPQAADFALITDAARCPPLSDFAIGTPEYPEASTTLLLQLDSLTAGGPVRLRGPGIRHEQRAAPALPADFWLQWQINHRHYPLGVDGYCFCDRRVMGLPRSMAVVTDG